MSCHGCAVKFGIIIREKGCPNCGYSFCSKCLKHKTAVPSSDNEECKVCTQCYKILTGVVEPKKAEDISPPEAFLNPPDVDHLPSVPSSILPNQVMSKGNGNSVSDEDVDSVVKRLESLENPAKPPITVYQHDHRFEKLKSGLSQEDADIADRLQKLKEDTLKILVPTEDELLRRLATLKGEDPEQKVAIATKKIYFTPDTRSNEEKTDALIKQLLEEQILSVKKITPDDMIARRLAKLREGTEDSATGLNLPKSDDVKSLLKATEAQLKAQKKKPDGDSSSSDDDSEVNALVEKMYRQAQLNMKLKQSSSVKTEEEELEEEGSEELPWCVICNEDASLRCLDCDREIYCSKCFSEMHRNEGWATHKTVPFHKKLTQ